MCISLGYENECGKGWLHCKFHKELKTQKAIHRDYMLKNNNVSSEGIITLSQILSLAIMPVSTFKIAVILHFCIYICIIIMK